MHKRKYTSTSFLIIFILTFMSMNIEAFGYHREKLSTYSVTYDDSTNKTKTAPQQPKSTTWNLNSLYKNEAEWKKQVKEFDKDTKELKNYIGKVTKSPTHLAFALDIKEKLDTRLNSIYAYIRLNQDINKTSYKYLDMNDDLNKVYSSYMDICSDLELEILKVNDKDFKKFMKNKTIDKKYKMYLNDIRRSKDHYLDDKSEDILRSASSLGSLPKNIYELFRNMDKKTNMTSAQYATMVNSHDREQRKLAYQSEFVGYNDNINTISGLLIGQVKRNIFYAHQRGYDSSLQMYLEADDIDVKVYNKLISTVNKNLDSLHKYTDLRKEVLNLDKVYYYDMFVPFIEPVDNNITYEKAQGMIYSALSPLGKEYSDMVYKAFNERWIDVYSHENKVSGGYCLSVYDNHPYILLNYNNSLGAVSTLSHELGHACYEYLSSKNQNYFNSNPSIFTHEVASMTNEALLYETLIKNATNNDQKAYYITQYLDMIKDTLYTQTMYAEFEKNIHEKVERGESMNALVLNDEWSSLMKKYYGKSYEADPLSMIGWSRIPHFYNSFYVYKYATGCSAGISFAKEIMENGSENYMNLLKKGSSDYPINLLKQSGVNLTTTKPIDDSIEKFDSLLTELEKILDKNK